MEEAKYRISLEDYFSGGLVKAEENMNVFEGAVNHIGSSIKQMAGIAIASFGAMQSFEFFKGSAEKFLESEKAAKQLQFAVQAHGGLAEDYKNLNEQSERFKENGIFSHREIQSAQTAMLNYGVSIRKVSEDMETFVNVAAQRNSTPEEISRLILRAATTGRAMRLGQYFNGQIPVLEKGIIEGENGEQMSNTGAEARNMVILMDALKKNNKDGMASIMETDFGKIENLKLRWESFQKSIGQGIADSFARHIPEIKAFIKNLENIYSWIKKNWETFKDLAKAAAEAFVIIKTATLVAEAVIALTTAITGAGAAFSAFALFVEANPLTATAVAIGGLILLYNKLATAMDAARTAQERGEQEIYDRNKEEASKIVQEESLEYSKKSGKTDIRKIEIGYAQKEFDLAGTEIKKIEDELARWDLSKQQTDVLNLRLKALEGSQAGFKALINRNTANSQDLGSSTLEPKAGQIKQITINVPYAFQYAFKDMKVTETIDSIKNAKDQIAELFVSIVTDAAVVAEQ